MSYLFTIKFQLRSQFLDVVNSSFDYNREIIEK